MLASKPNNEVKHEIEINSITILKELKLFFMNNKYRISKPQNCTRYNSALEIHNAELVYDEEERIHKLWVNDESLEPQSAIQMLTAIIASLEALNARNPSGTPAVSNPMSAGSAAINACAAGDVITIIGDVTAGGSLYIGGNHKHKHYDKPILDEAALNAKETQALSQLKASYSTPEYTTISGIFGPPLKLEGQYINLQILCTDLKTKKTEEKESKDSGETKRDEKYKDARMASVEDLFGDKRAIKAENLFKPVRELFDNQALEIVKNANEVPHLLLVQGRAGIGKTIFVHYTAHQWSKGQIYENYTWVFTLTLRKLRLLPNTPELSLPEWIRQSQFSDWSSKEFDELWRQRIETAISQDKVLLILDGYDETPENHPCQSVLKNLLTSSGRYSKLSLLITTRPCGAQDISEKRRNLEIIGFTDENINQYIQTYFLKAPDKTLVNTLTETLSKQPVVWANAHIPLNLNLLCGIMEEAIQKAYGEGLSQGLAQLSSMTRLYQVMEKKLYERSYATHNTASSSVGKQLVRAQTNFTKYYQKERFFLAKLAFQSFEAERIIIPLQSVGATLQGYIDKEMPINNQQQKEALGEAFFKTVCELGLIKPVLDTNGLSETKQDYEFLHLTFQEYYTAIYLAEAFSGQEPTTQILAQKIILKEKYNPRWQIVCWFVAGLLRENAPFYAVYLQHLQGQREGQKDVLEHYQLGLLTRAIDEGFEPQNRQVIEPIVKQLQSSFLNLYQTAKSVTNNDGYGLSWHPFINSPFFLACRISSSLCMSGEQDLYALISEPPNQWKGQHFLSAWIGTVRVVTPKMLGTLLGLLVDKAWYVRRSAAQEAMDHLGIAAATPKILEALLGLLVDKEIGVRSSAAEALGNFGVAAATPKMLDTLLGLLAHERSDVRSSAAEVLGNFGVTAAMPKTLDALLELLSDEEHEVRSSGAKALGNLGTAAAMPKVLDALSGLLADADWFVRSSGAEALGKLGAAVATPKVLDALLGLLKGEEREVRSSGIEALGKLGAAVATPKMLDALLELLAHERSDVRSSSAKALGNLGIAAAMPKVLDALSGLLVDADWFVRSSGAEALGKLGAAVATPKVLDALLGLLTDEENNVHGFVAEALGKLRGAATMPKMLDALLELLAHERSDVRSSSAKALGNLGIAAAMPKVLDALSGLLADADSFVRRDAAEALGKLGAPTTPKMLDVLLELLAHERSDVRSSSAKALGNLGTAAAIQKVLDGFSGLLADADSFVRRDAADALGNLGAAAATPKMLDILLGLLADKNDWVRNSAIATLDKLTSDTVPALFLDWLLGIFSVINNDSTLRVFGMHIDSVFTLMPSFWADNANHPNILAFVSHILAAAYLNSHISCQIGFDENGAPVGYYIRGFAGKSRYHFLISEEQAQILQRLSPLIIEQLSKTGKLDIAELRRHLPGQQAAAQISSTQRLREGAGAIIHLPVNFVEQKGSMLTQYQGSKAAAEPRTNRDSEKVKNTCRIS